MRRGRSSPVAPTATIRPLSRAISAASTAGSLPSGRGRDDDEIRAEPAAPSRHGGLCARRSHGIVGAERMRQAAARRSEIDPEDAATVRAEDLRRQQADHAEADHHRAVAELGLRRAGHACKAMAPDGRERRFVEADVLARCCAAAPGTTRFLGT